MAHRVVWTAQATSDLIEAAAPAARTSERYALAFTRRAFADAQSLSDFPLQGHVYGDSDNPALREIPVRGHCLVYLVESETVRGLAFFHGSRQPPDVTRRLEGLTG